MKLQGSSLSHVFKSRTTRELVIISDNGSILCLIYPVNLSANSNRLALILVLSLEFQRLLHRARIDPLILHAEGQLEESRGNILYLCLFFKRQLVRQHLLQQELLD